MAVAAAASLPRNNVITGGRGRGLIQSTKASARPARIAFIGRDGPPITRSRRVPEGAEEGTRRGLEEGEDGRKMRRTPTTTCFRPGPPSPSSVHLFSPGWSFQGRRNICKEAQRLVAIISRLTGQRHVGRLADESASLGPSRIDIMFRHCARPRQDLNPCRNFRQRLFGAAGNPTPSRPLSLSLPFPRQPPFLARGLPGTRLLEVSIQTWAWIVLQMIKIT